LRLAVFHLFIKISELVMLSNVRLFENAAEERAHRSDVQWLRPLPADQNISHLAPYASFAGQSRGRQSYEPPCPSRTPFARDRDRIIHSTAFRRLNFKTQVFVCYEGDHYRNRLTHSLEVAQIARSLARLMKLDEDLAEAIALAHDIGHTPFGHAGERALHRVLSGFGGFDHNLQTFRVLTKLERRYADFDGLNLSWEMLEGLIKHNGPLCYEDGRGTGAYSGAYLPPPLLQIDAELGLELHLQTGLEAQVAAIADDIAYNNHDIDDGLRAGLIELEDLEEVELVWSVVRELRVEHPGLETDRLVFELNRRLINLMILDVVQETQNRIADLQPTCLEDIRRAGGALVSFSKGFERQLDQLRDFLYQAVYRHERVMTVMRDAERVVEDLVTHYMNRPKDLPHEWACGMTLVNINECAGRIRDYIAGMTDRYALDLHRSLFDATPNLR
jgi:dGTPase